MADMIARLKVDSSEYDSKVKRAAEGILNLERTIREAGESFIQTWKDEQEFAKGLGQMETVSKTARGKISELTSAFTEMSLVYKRMTDEEKASPFGKALQGSLDQLKGRIQEAKKDLADINKELGNTKQEGQSTGSIIEQLTGKFGVSTKALMGWGAALTAGKLALDTAKNAIESTEATHDAYARSVAAMDSVTNQFYRSLANADFSSFLSGLQDIIDKSREAYNAMDEFGSYGVRFAPWQSIREQQINVKLQEARASKAKGDTKKAEQLTNEAKELINQLEKATETYGKMQEKAGVATIKDLMGTVDISEWQIGWYANPENFDKANQKAEKYKELTADISKAEKEIALTLNSTRRGSASLYDTYDPNETKKIVEEAKARIAAAQAQIDADPSLLRAYTFQNLRDDTESKQGNMFNGALANIYGKEAAAARIASLRARSERMEGVITGRDGKTTKAEKTYDTGIQLKKGMVGLTDVTIVTYESMEDLQRQLTAYKTALNRATNVVEEMAARQGIADTEWKMSDVGRSAAKLGWDKGDVDSVIDEMQNAIGDKIVPITIKPVADKGGISEMEEDVEKMANNWREAGSAISAVGNAMSKIEDPAAKVMGTIAQAIATIALTYAKSLEGTFTPWDWIAGAAAGLTQMTAVITTIKSVTEGNYAEGGIIPGSSFSGDNLRGMTPDGRLYGLNAGELILSRSQQSNLAGALQGAGGQITTYTPYVSGEQIFLGMNNYLRRTGRGELVTARG